LQALSGGRVILSNLLSLGNGYVDFLVDGTNSAMDLAGLSNYQGTNRAPTFTVRNGGTVSLPSLRNYRQASGCLSTPWQASGPGSVLDLSGLTNLVGGDCGALNIWAMGGGLVVLSNVVTIPESYVAVLADGTNSVVDLSGLVDYLGSSKSLALEARSGGSILVPQLVDARGVSIMLKLGGFISTAQITNIDKSSLYVSGGAVLSLPGLRSYGGRTDCGSSTWQASGAGSVLDLSGLTNLAGGDCGSVNIQALSGGQVVLSNVVRIPDSNVSVLADGTNSVVDLSSLVDYLGSSKSLALEARSGGSIVVPKLVELVRANLIVRNTGLVSL
jgi:hypothetical protein